MAFPVDDSRIRSLLVLRHLADGDVIDYPVPEDHPQHALLTSLEAQGLIARWDRIWPLHDRYRLTDRGVAEIEQVYQPGKAEAVRRELEAQGTPQARSSYLRSRGLDPVIWPILHDPYTHWMIWGPDPGPLHRFVWGGLSGMDDAAGAGASSMAPAVADHLLEMNLDREARTASRRRRDEEGAEDIS